MKTMKAITALAVTLLFVAGFTPESNAQTPSGEKTVTFETSIHCDGCKKTVETGLMKEKGVKSVVADSKTKMVTVTYDESQISDASLVKSIEGLGYKAKVVDPNAAKSKDASKKSGGGC